MAYLTGIDVNLEISKVSRFYRDEHIPPLNLSYAFVKPFEFGQASVYTWNDCPVYVIFNKTRAVLVFDLENEKTWFSSDVNPRNRRVILLIIEYKYYGLTSSTIVRTPPNPVIIVSINSPDIDCKISFENPYLLFSKYVNICDVPLLVSIYDYLLASLFGTPEDSCAPDYECSRKMADTDIDSGPEPTDFLAEDFLRINMSRKNIEGDPKDEKFYEHAKCGSKTAGHADFSW